MTALWLKRSKCEETNKKPVDPYLAAKEVKSSCVMLVVESFDRMSFSASSLMSRIPSFQYVSAKSGIPIETPTAVAKEYIERGEQARCCCTSAPAIGSLSHIEVWRDANFISSV